MGIRDEEEREQEIAEAYATLQQLKSQVSARAGRIITATVDDLVSGLGTAPDLSPEQRYKIMTELVDDLSFIVAGYRGLRDGNGHPQPQKLAASLRYIGNEREREEGDLMPMVGSYLKGIADQLEASSRLKVRSEGVEDGG